MAAWQWFEQFPLSKQGMQQANRSQPGATLVWVLLVTIAGTLTLAVAMGIGRFIYTPILPAMIEDQVLNRSQAGQVAAFNYIGYLFGALLSSLSILGSNRRMWLLAALGLNALTTYLMGFTGNLNLIYILRFASGVTSAFAMIFVSSMVFDAIARSGKDWLLSLHFSGVGLGITASALFVPLVAGWQAQWVTGGFFSAIGLLLVLGLIHIGPKYEPQNPIIQQSGGDHLHNKRKVVGSHTAQKKSVQYLILAYGLFGFGYVITATFISELARSVPELNHLKDDIWFYVGIAAVFSTLICNLIAARIGLLLTFTAACLVEAVGVAASVLFDDPGVLVFSALLLGGTFVGATAIGLMAATRLSSTLQVEGEHSDFGRKIIALMTVSFGIGQVLGPWLAGWLFQFSGNLVAASFCAVLALILSSLLTMAVRANSPI